MRSWLCAILVAMGMVSWAWGAAVEEAGWGREPVQSVSRTRGQMALDGVWRFQPAVGEAQKEPKEAWGYIQVPGDWRNTAARPGVVKQGTGEAWASFNGDEVAVAWYEREFVVPREWAGRAIMLDFERVSTDAVVFVNGKRCGAVAWPGNGGSVEITSAVKPGEKATVRLLVAATEDEKEAQQFRDKNEGKAIAKASKLESRGVIGSVIVRSRPTGGAHLRDVFVRPSTRQEMVLIEVELSGMKVAESVYFTARMIDETGREEKRFERAMVVEAKDRQTIHLAWKWGDAKRWELGRPHLYTVKLEAKGPGLDDELAQTFGFREFWMEGGRYLLNGQEIQLRPARVERMGGSAEEMAAGMEAMKKAGFNMEEHPARMLNRRGVPDERHRRAEIADRKGWLILAGALPVNDYIVDGQGKPVWRERENANRKKWEQDITLDLRRVRNHPSILMWTAGVDLFGKPKEGQSVLEMKGWKPGNADQERLGRYAKEAVEILKKQDPTRVVVYPK